MKKDRRERIGNDLSEYQKWVDYDMKKYGRISDITKGKIRKAGLSIVKDQYGDYEVIADRPIKEGCGKLNEKSDYNALRKAREFIKGATSRAGFYDKIREILKDAFIEDWDIKNLQRLADAKHHELGGFNESYYDEWKKASRMAKVYKELYPKGTRIELISMDNDPDPIAPGTKGTVIYVDALGQLGMKWDNGRTLSLIPGEDSFKVINEGCERKVIKEEDYQDDPYKGIVVEYVCPLTIRAMDVGYYEDLYKIRSSSATKYLHPIRRALTKEHSYDGCDPESMARYQDNPKVEWVRFDVDNIGREICGIIRVGLKEELSTEEEARLIKWIEGQCSDGFGENFEQTDIKVDDGDRVLNVSFWAPYGHWSLKKGFSYDQKNESLKEDIADDDIDKTYRRLSKLNKVDFGALEDEYLETRPSVKDAVYKFYGTILNTNRYCKDFVKWAKEEKDIELKGLPCDKGDESLKEAKERRWRRRDDAKTC